MPGPDDDITRFALKAFVSEQTDPFGLLCLSQFKVRDCGAVHSAEVGRATDRYSNWPLLSLLKILMAALHKEQLKLLRENVLKVLFFSEEPEGFRTGFQVLGVNEKRKNQKGFLDAHSQVTGNHLSFFFFKRFFFFCNVALFDFLHVGVGVGELDSFSIRDRFTDIVVNSVTENHASQFANVPKLKRAVNSLITKTFPQNTDKDLKCQEIREPWCKNAQRPSFLGCPN